MVQLTIQSCYSLIVAARGDIKQKYLIRIPNCTHSAPIRRYRCEIDGRGETDGGNPLQTG